MRLRGRLYLRVNIYFRSCNRCDKENKTRLLLQYDDNFSFIIDIFATIPFELLALTFSGGGDIFLSPSPPSSIETFQT